MQKLVIILTALLAIALVIGGICCKTEMSSTPVPTNTPTPAPTLAPTPTQMPTPIPTLIPTPTPVLTPVPTPEPTQAVTPAPTPVITPTPVPTQMPIIWYMPPPPPTPIPVAGVDAMGRPFEFSTPPQRIVSHVPSITETFFALGLNEQIVGVSDFCNYPEEAKSKPKIGGYFDPSIEAIVALEPDIVLTDGHVSAIDQLEGLGIPFVVIQPKDIDGVLDDISLLGYITAAEQMAEEIILDMRARIDAVVDTVGGAYTTRVFYVFDATDPTKPWTAGPTSFVNDLIQLAGGDNIAAQAAGPWVQFSIEELVDSDPEIIIVDSMMGTAVISPEEIKELTGWKDTTAAKDDRIYAIDGDLVNRTGPRIVQGLEEMAKVIHPELFGS